MSSIEVDFLPLQEATMPEYTNTPITVVSTVVVPSFDNANVVIRRITSEKELANLLSRASRNLCGHPATNAVLKSICPELPEPERGFWDGVGFAIAARPKGGVRGSKSEGKDVEVTSFDDLEACLFVYTREE
jgi:hypothetical protein